MKAAGADLKFLSRRGQCSRFYYLIDLTVPFLAAEKGGAVGSHLNPAHRVAQIQAPRSLNQAKPRPCRFFMARGRRRGQPLT